jgi:Zn-dependent protease
MKGSFQLLRVFNIPVLIHWTFLLIFVGLGGMSYLLDWSWMKTAWNIVFAISLFACVLLHEFGHALTARYYGVSTRDIILSPIGGVARLDKLPENPIHEFMVAIAGPMVNVLISLVVSVLVILVSEKGRLQLYNYFSAAINPQGNHFAVEVNNLESFLFVLIALNIILALFNMLPAFPMDGGRVLRSLLSIRLGKLRATRIAAYIGQSIAVMFIIYGYLNMSYLLSVVGIFVFIMAKNEYRAAKLDKRLEQSSVADAYRRNFTPLYLSESVSEATEKVNPDEEKYFLVFNEWQEVVGVVSGKALKNTAEKGALNTTIAQLYSKLFESLLPGDPLKEVFNKMSNPGQYIAAVYEKGQLVGILDRPSVYRFLEQEQQKARSTSFNFLARLRG